MHERLYEAAVRIDMRRFPGDDVPPLHPVLGHEGERSRRMLYGYPPSAIASESRQQWLLDAFAFALSSHLGPDPILAVLPCGAAMK